MEQLSSKKYMDRYEEGIRDDEKFQDAKEIERKDDETIKVITKEGYVYVVKVEKVEYIGRQGENPPPDLQESDVTFHYEPTDWTNESVEISIETEITGYTLQYSIDEKKWTDYTTAITMKDNGAIYARLINNLDEVGGTATGNVENIDRLAPNSFTPTATSTTNSITLTGNTTDKAKTVTDGCSGIAKYYFSKDDGATWEPSAGQTGTSYTFTGLTQNKSYSLKMKAVDKAGNETITNTVSKNTGTVTGLTDSNVKFTYNPSTPTKSSVAVTITTEITGYTLQYSTNGTTWTNYTTAVTMTDNGAIYARLWDGVNGGGYATGNVTNIDKTLPTAAINLSNTNTDTASSITAKVTHNDANSGVKIASCKWVYNTISTEIGTNASSYTGGIFTSNGQTIILSATTSGIYYLHVLTTDNAGNVKETISNAITVSTPLLAKVANVGEYVAYNATNNYSYTSPKGTGSSHGNGSASQTFKSSSSIKWRILSKDETTGEVVLISETPIGDFTLNGAIGYLYAEEELNRICSIYGHGTGANTGKTFTCQTGDTVEGLSTVTLTGSGAKSVNVDDILLMFNISRTKSLKEQITYYPTKNNNTGISTNYDSRTYNDEGFGLYIMIISGAEPPIYTESENYKLLFKDITNSNNINYYLASRMVGTFNILDNNTSFSCFHVSDGGTGGSYCLFQSRYSWGNGSFNENAYSDNFRPVVYLKSNIQTSGKDSNGAWIIK